MFCFRFERMYWQLEIPARQGIISTAFRILIIEEELETENVSLDTIASTTLTYWTGASQCPWCCWISSWSCWSSLFSSSWGNYGDTWYHTDIWDPAIMVADLLWPWPWQHHLVRHLLEDGPHQRSCKKKRMTRKIKLKKVHHVLSGTPVMYSDQQKKQASIVSWSSPG